MHVLRLCILQAHIEAHPLELVKAAGQSSLLTDSQDQISARYVRADTSVVLTGTRFYCYIVIIILYSLRQLLSGGIAESIHA